MDPLDDIQDMSTNGGMGWQTVTLLVGSERRAFQVHVKRLGPLEAHLRPLSERIEKPDWDPDVFNLIMNWTYNTPLPRIQNLAKWFDLEKPHHDLRLLNSDRFDPYTQRGPPESELYERLNTLSAQPRHQRFSIEELRLHFVQSAAYIQMSRGEAIEQPIGESESIQGPQARKGREGANP
ncbi:hypothetical protein E0Z10_g9116 [Xylaria hypoxylon]|uniref:Uncharacterized protein n=1 Tax=Xylaria hypoxylon TaxID=37992 RepID=A0A4Z0YLA5_9PEZI|nr:hypothetical protein E0Z10_g9116 [Xylaria hypoxylon]